MKQDSDTLSRLLHEWTVTPVPEVDLTQKVWLSIAAREAAQETGWAGLWLRLNSWLARPQAIAMLTAGALLLGVGLAEWRSCTEVSRINAEMSARYLALVAVPNP